MLRPIWIEGNYEYLEKVFFDILTYKSRKG